MNPAAAIIAGTPWLTLATVAADGAPQASYVPFATVNDGLAIVVSGLAAHTQNLLERPRASVLVVAQDVATDTTYARARISIEAHARPAPAGSETAARIWAALALRHGGFTATLQTLPDFIAFTLEPFRSRLILGFAAAHDLDGYATIEQIRVAQQQTHEPH